jgi:phage baseplate assembly protein W
VVQRQRVQDNSKTNNTIDINNSMAQFNSVNKSSRVARRWWTDIDINMKTHPETNDVSLKYDINSIKRSVRNLILTNNYERPFKPGLGLNLRGSLFELGMAHTKVLENNIIEMIDMYEPRASVKTVFINSIGNSLNVTIHLIIGNDPQPHELDLILERVR